MINRDMLLDYVENYKKSYPNCGEPIYTIMVFEHPDKELVYKKDTYEKKSGFPDLGAAYEPGFYYNLDLAIEAMHKNACDIRETLYNAGFILCHFQGLTACASKDARIYFKWDTEKQGYFEAEEPIIFSHMAY